MPEAEAPEAKEPEGRSPRTVGKTSASAVVSNTALATVLIYGNELGLLPAWTGAHDVAIIALWNVIATPLGTFARNFAHEFKAAGKTVPWWARPFVQLAAGWLG